ncbi:MAG: hypothetical protein FWD35_04655 [Oscillospiraceae bacterium]|nr:hypothetical protein [Oscillospiraceae bacterium]
MTTEPKYAKQAESYLNKQTEKQSWDDIEDDDPLPDEILAFEEFRANKTK